MYIIDIYILRQASELLAINNTRLDAISPRVRADRLWRPRRKLRAFFADRLCEGPDQEKKVGQLSGGAQPRPSRQDAQSGANLLLLDEPTNDLDVDTLRALEEALTDFAGCALISSHDRFFLDRVATHMLAFEGDSHVEWFEGNFADYEEDKKR